MSNTGLDGVNRFKTGELVLGNARGQVWGYRIDTDSSCVPIITRTTYYAVFQCGNYRGTRISEAEFQTIKEWLNANVEFSQYSEIHTRYPLVDDPEAE